MYKYTSVLRVYGLTDPPTSPSSRINADSKQYTVCSGSRLEIEAIREIKFERKYFFTPQGIEINAARKVLSNKTYIQIRKELSDTTYILTLH